MIRFVLLGAVLIGAAGLLFVSPPGSGAGFPVAVLLAVVSLLGICVSLAALVRHRIN